MTPYLKRRTLYPQLIREAPDPALGMVVVIPAYDEPSLVDSLQALQACHPPGEAVEVIVVINHAATEQPEVKARNEACFEDARSWATANRSGWLRFHVLYCPDLPPKHAGVGLARKIGMDEACRRFDQVGKPEGIILGFDADSRCDPNYFQAISEFFRSAPDTHAAGIYFEHPLEGIVFKPEVYRAITLYELHLRYFINAQRWLGMPFAQQTIGSSMAVRANAYQREGGMNRRKAGEDFYFLHKFTKLGHFGEINGTRVIPSPRPSHRVPFGTGRSVLQLLEQQLQGMTYAPASFVMLRPFIRQVPDLYHSNTPFSAPAPLHAFLESVKLEDRLEEMHYHTRSQRAFCQRFFRWFDAFLLMKYLHFMRDHHFPNVPVLQAACWLTEVSGYSTGPTPSVKALLELWRTIDRTASG